MATRSLKGITVEIGGDTSKLTTALKGANSAIKDTQSRLKDVTSLLKIDPSNVELLTKKEELLSDAIKGTSEKLEILKTAQDQATEAMEKGTMSQDQYNALAAEIVRTESSLKNLKTQQENAQSPIQQLNTKIENQTADLKLLKDKYADVVIKEGENSASAKDLAGKISDLSGELKENKEKLQDAKTKADELDQSFDNAGDAAEDSAKKSNDAANGGYTVLKDVMADLASESIQKVINGLKNVATEAWNTAIEYESAFTGVKKTVEGTDEQLETIDEGLRDLATKTASDYTTLAGVAENAGQLGIATDDVLEFTKIMTMLGDSTNLSSDEASSALAKLANITGLDSSQYSNLGSAIVDLGNNFATTESDIVAMTTRLASTSNIAGFSTADMLALATALNSVGIEAEAGGSAISKTIKKMQLAVETGWWKKPTNKTPGVELKDIAKIAGLTEKEFKKLFKSNPAKALSLFVDGLSDTKRNGKSAIVVLDELGVTEVRQSNALLALSKSNGLLTKAVDMSSEAWKDNTALTEEAEKRYETTESQLIQTKNRFKNLTAEMGDKFLPVTEKLLDKASDFIDAHSDDLVDFAEKLADGLSTGFDWILDHGDVVTTTLDTLGTIIVTKFAYSTIKNIASGVGNFFSGLKNFDTDAIGTAISLVAGAATAIWDVGHNSLLSRYKLDELTKNFEENHGKFEEFKSIVENTGKKVDETATYESTLKDKLLELVDPMGKVKEGHEKEAEAIVEELNDALGTNIQIREGEIEKIDQVAKSIDNLIAKKRAEALMEGNKEAYTKALANQLSSYDAWQEARKDVAQIIADADEYANDFGKKGSTLYNLRFKYYTDFVIGDEYDDAVEKMNTLGEEYKQYVSTIELYENAMAASSEKNYDLMNIYLGGISSGIKTAKVATTEELKTQRDGFKATYDEMLADSKSGEQKITQSQLDAAYERYQAADMQYDASIKQAEDKTLEEIMGCKNTIDANLYAIAESADNVSMAAVNKITGNSGKMGTAGVTYGVNFVGGLNSQQEGAKNAGVNLIKSTYYAMADTIAGKYNLSNVARDAIAGYLREMESGGPKAAVAAAQLGVATLTGIQESLDSHSPSREMAKIGGYAVSGYVNTLKNPKNLREAALASSGLGLATLEGITKSLNIRSPSRKMAKIAKYTISGYVDELLNKRSEVAEAAKSIADTVLEEFDNDLNVKGSIGFDFESLDNIKRSIQNNPVQQNYERPSIAQPKGDTINNITQNNYSPKALSRPEIYRQTKNLLKMIKTKG